jgi:hypothetical protein
MADANAWFSTQLSIANAVAEVSGLKLSAK